MIYAAVNLTLAIQFAALAYRMAHVEPWHSALLGAVFAYIAIAGVFGALGVGRTMQLIAAGVGVLWARWRAPTGS